MFSYIKGSVEYKYLNYVVLDVNGIGYRIYSSLPTLESIPEKGEVVKLNTMLYVREDTMVLYGFISQEELGMFELLISVSGIGPKVALNAVSAISPSKFGLAIITEDIKTLTKIPGVGNKTAQRIILELKDKIDKEQVVGKSDEVVGSLMDSHVAEAINALLVLGYTPLEARNAVKRVTSDTRDVEVVVKEALKTLVRN